MTKTIRFVSRYMGTIRYKKRCMLIKKRFSAMRFDAMQFNNWKHRVERRQWTSFSKHFLTCLIKYLLTNLKRPTSEKISAGFMNAWKFVLNWTRFLMHLNLHTETPRQLLIRACYYAHTPQATRKQLQRLIKIISKQAPVNPDLISPGQRWRYCYRM